jgi:hypothetical protein
MLGCNPYEGAPERGCNLLHLKPPVLLPIELTRHYIARRAP